MEHNWRILEEKILPEYLNQTNVIKTIWFELSTTEGEKNAVIHGRLSLNIDTLDNFIEYSNIDLQTKINWIKSHAGDFYENLNIEYINTQYQI